LGWVFLRLEEVLKIHTRMIELFGGRAGIRDEGVLTSALQAAENRRLYENADLAACAATYAYHLTQAHAFVDGNKRVAAAVTEVFLEINGARLAATNEQIIDLFMGVAASKISREQVEELLKCWIVDPSNKS
jgi:death-on-curing protein